MMSVFYDLIGSNCHASADSCMYVFVISNDFCIMNKL